MAQKVTIPSGSVLSGIISEVQAIDLDAALISNQGEKCEHFKPFGVPKEFTKKLFVYMWSLEKRASELTASLDEKLQKVQIDMPSGTAQELEAAIKRARAKVKAVVCSQITEFVTQVGMLELLIRLELSEQFPEARDPDVNNFFVDEDWTVGWIDHSHFAEELVEQVKRFVPLGSDGRALFGVGRDGKPIPLDEFLRGAPPEVANGIRSIARSLGLHVEEAPGH